MRKNILLPTDFSNNALNAINYALKLFKNEECTFYFLNATEIHASAMSNLTSKLHETINEEALHKLKELKKQIELENIYSDFDFQIILSSESLVTAITKNVIKYSIDVVVMGTKGATGAKGLFFGSNTSTIISKMNFCPILVIPENYDFVTPTQIVFPTDFKRFYSNIELKPLKDLATLYKSKIRVVHINIEDKLDDIQEKNMSILTEYLKNFEHSFHWVPDFTNKTKSICTFIDELEINMLIMVNYRHSFIENIIKEPVIKKVGAHPVVPFMVVQDLN